MEEVTVTARKNLENERTLQLERQRSSVAIENLGAKEMSVKGISNVEEGVKKNNRCFHCFCGTNYRTRLGDRYSTTTLNGLPIASPNPDNKLIPLNLFPTSTVKTLRSAKYTKLMLLQIIPERILISVLRSRPEKISSAFHSIQEESSIL